MDFILYEFDFILSFNVLYPNLLESFKSLYLHLYLSVFILVKKKFPSL